MQIGNVACDDSRLSVANHRRNALCLTRDFGLLTKWLQLSTHFTGEIAKASQVGLHRFEFALGALLASAVLQDSGGLFDEPATICRTRLKNVL